MRRPRGPGRRRERGRIGKPVPRVSAPRALLDPDVHRQRLHKMRKIPDSGRHGARGAALLAISSAAVIALAGCGGGSAKTEARTVAVARTSRTALSNSMTLQAEFRPYQ